MRQALQARCEHLRFVDRDGSTMVKIVAGEFYVAKPPEKIATLLGSCVSACVRDPVARLGGMNHFMLPHHGRGWSEVTSDANRYGSWAMENLINALIKQGARRDRFEIKLFGGASVGRMKANIGQQNIAFVENFLLREGLDVAARSLGGTAGRKIVYEVATGKVLMLRLPEVVEQRVAEEEARLDVSLEHADGGGELF